MTCEKRWDEMRRAEMRWEELTWFEMRWSVECEVRGVKSAVWSVKKVFAWRCIAPGSRAGHVLGQQHRNSFAQSTHARAWLAHGACKFYRWERSYSISLRQLPPRLVRVLLVYIYNMIFISSNFKDNLFQLYNVISIFNFKLVQYNFISLLRNCGNQQQVVQKKLSASICKLQQLPATFPLGWSIHMMHILQHHLDISIQ